MVPGRSRLRLEVSPATVASASEADSPPWPVSLLSHTKSRVQETIGAFNASGAPWVMAVDEGATLRVLSDMSGYVLGGVGEQSFIKRGSLSVAELRNVKLAAKVKIILAIPLEHGAPSVLGLRAGGGTGAEEESLNTLYLEEAKKDPLFRGFAADGIKKDQWGPFEPGATPSAPPQPQHSTTPAAPQAQVPPPQQPQRSTALLAPPPPPAGQPPARSVVPPPPPPGAAPPPTGGHTTTIVNLVNVINVTPLAIEDETLSPWIWLEGAFEEM